MDTNLNTCIYDADIYLRLSKEDGDKEESDSITNQRELILGFLKSRNDIRVHEICVDDGYSGINFQRPAFQQMLQDIREGKVNCVITKDLSRLGRNHIEVGKYIEKIFPYLGVRYIAVNDHYDSINANRQDNIIVPFKNLINDAYCRDISIKTRTNLEAKRKKGDFVGSFAPYGYCKSEGNKNRLEIDDEGAEVVRLIFKWFLQGCSAYRIADKLNATGILTPMDYKRSKGSGFYTGFRKRMKGEWNHVMVARILSNPVYTGVLVQGKRTTPNYKLQKRVYKDSDEWNRVENTHPALVSPVNFRNVQQLLSMDTRTANREEKLYCLSGFVKCGGCGANMVRKTVPYGDRRYVYLVCGTHKADKKVCSPHSIRTEHLEETILKLLNYQIGTVADVESVLKKFDLEKRLKGRAEKRAMQIQKKKQEMQRFYEMKLNLYEDYKDELLTKEEYTELKSFYEEKTRALEKLLEKMETEASLIEENTGEANEWLNEFRKYGHLKSLSREAAVSLIDTVSVHERRNGERYSRIEVHFKYEEELQASMEFIKKYGDREKG